MTRFRDGRFWIARLAAALSIGLLSASAVLAADEPQKVGQSYVVPYMLTILVCSLGIMIVGHSSHRTTEVKPVDDD
ncbi:MAG TPA: hypothetical protein VHX65_11775 [Pirellulales bacterium]|jgi:hypothetical protein|nr:hypothetical protein [Pirellulales bacterium]